MAEEIYRAVNEIILFYSGISMLCISQPNAVNSVRFVFSFIVLCFVFPL